jgi:dTDP-4-amino-4,6-dideoxygalactose transaminase
MSKNDLDRRHFLGTVSAATGAVGLGLLKPAMARPIRTSMMVEGKPAILGGTPVRTDKFPSWPQIDEADRKAWVKVLDDGRWNRGPRVDEFEAKWAEAMGAKYAIATSSGTSALVAALRALDIGPGDEVIVSPYTFIATINVVLMQYALPVFVDTDRRTHQVDAKKIAAAITDKTRCIIPVHLGGNPADLDTVLATARKHKIPVIEDACQAHFAEWKNKGVGSWGDMGCFSFQASKNLNSGEGGSVITSNGEYAAACMSYQNVGRGYIVDEKGALKASRKPGWNYARNGDNRRMTEFQGTILLGQLSRLEKQARIREQNAEYLAKRLKEIGGVIPAETYEGTTRNAYHLFMAKYVPEEFAGLSRVGFNKAMRAEGVGCGAGYPPINKEPYIKELLDSPGFRKIYTEKEIQDWHERNMCPENDKLCEDGIWWGQTTLLAERSGMDDIANAVERIKKNAEAIKKAVVA